MSAHRRGDNLFEYGGHWLNTEPGRAAIYAYWYDERSRKTRRRSLGTEILEDAKTKLIAIVLKKGSADPADPESVMVALALDHYFENRAKALPSAETAKRAIALLVEFLADELQDPALKVGAFTKATQERFMRWSREAHGHSAGTISRNLSVAATAFEFGASPQAVTDGFGEQREVQLLRYAPKIGYQAKDVAEKLDIADSVPREWIPTYAQLGKFIDAIRSEHVFRYTIVALNTWARPEAITDLDVSAQVDFTHKLVDLNPPGRRQNKKRRARIRLTTNLDYWLRKWDTPRPLTYGGEPIASAKKAFNRTARRKEVGLPKLTRVTLRHFMATMVRRIEPPVSREQRSIWLGHAAPEGSKTTAWYESMDPEFLAEAARATDQVIAELQKHTRKTILAPTQHPQIPLRSIEGGKAGS